MKFVVSYYENSSRVLFPIEAESVETAERTFKKALKEAVLAGHRTFCLWGYRHTTAIFAKANSLKGMNAYISLWRSRGTQIKRTTDDTFRLDETTSEADAVEIMLTAPNIWTLEDWIEDDQKEGCSRPLKWVKVENYFLHLLDERANREIVLPADEVHGGGAKLTPEKGPAVIFSPEMEYSIFQQGEIFKIMTGIFTLKIRKVDSTLKILSAFDYFD